MLLSHRLPAHNADAARQEWRELLEGTHALYDASDARRAIVQRFLLHFDTEVRVRAQDRFLDLRHGSVGNFVFTGARLFFGSLESAVFLFCRLLGVSERARVLPVLDTTRTLTLSAALEDGSLIIGQNTLSHPPTLSEISLVVHKERAPGDVLPARVARIGFVNEFGERVAALEASSRVLAALRDAVVIVLGMGSLFSSLVPLLLPRGTGETLALRAIGSPSPPRVLILNSCHDRETDGLDARDFVRAVVNALNRYGELHHAPHIYLSHVFYSSRSRIHIDPSALRAEFSVEVCQIAGDATSDFGHYDTQALRDALLGLAHVQ